MSDKMEEAKKGRAEILRDLVEKADKGELSASAMTDTTAFLQTTYLIEILAELKEINAKLPAIEIELCYNCNESTKGKGQATLFTEGDQIFSSPKLCQDCLKDPERLAQAKAKILAS